MQKSNKIYYLFNKSHTFSERSPKLTPIPANRNPNTPYYAPDPVVSANKGTIKHETELAYGCSCHYPMISECDAHTVTLSLNLTTTV